jgi:hypothetical protein
MLGIIKKSTSVILVMFILSSCSNYNNQKKPISEDMPLENYLIQKTEKNLL